jgi:hypothetical protein
MKIAGRPRERRVLKTAACESGKLAVDQENTTSRQEKRKMARRGALRTDENEGTQAPV